MKTLLNVWSGIVLVGFAILLFINFFDGGTGETDILFPIVGLAALFYLLVGVLQLIRTSKHTHLLMTASLQALAIVCSLIVVVNFPGFVGVMMVGIVFCMISFLLNMPLYRG